MVTWPDRWQPDAIEAIAPLVGTDTRVEVLVGDPATSLHGSSLEGFWYWGDDDRLMVIYDRSGRPDVYPWSALDGPVLAVVVKPQGHRRRTAFREPRWAGPPQLG